MNRTSRTPIDLWPLGPQYRTRRRVTELLRAVTQLDMDNADAFFAWRVARHRPLIQPFLSPITAFATRRKQPVPASQLM